MSVYFYLEVKKKTIIITILFILLILWKHKLTMLDILLVDRYLNTKSIFAICRLILSEWKK